MILLGAIINAVFIFVGGILGLFLKKGLPKRVNDGVMKGLGLCVAYIGISVKRRKCCYCYFVNDRGSRYRCIY